METKEGGSTVATNAYDGINRQTTQVVSGTVQHYYYSADWQVLEERVGDSTSADRQFVWGLRYLDDLICRIQSTATRIFNCQDANWNSVAVIDAAGNVQQRFRYSAYGMPTRLNPDGSVATGSDTLSWESLYAGYRYDRDSGLYLVRYRWLQPLLGVWLTTDPIASAIIANRHLYGSDDPLSTTDPLGLMPVHHDFYFWDEDYYSDDEYLGESHYVYDVSCDGFGNLTLGLPNVSASSESHYWGDIFVSLPVILTGDFRCPNGSKGKQLRGIATVSITGGAFADLVGTIAGAAIAGLATISAGGPVVGAVIGSAAGWAIAQAVKEATRGTAFLEVTDTICCCCDQFGRWWANPEVHTYVSGRGSKEVYVSHHFDAADCFAGQQRKVFKYGPYRYTGWVIERWLS